MANLLTALMIFVCLLCLTITSASEVKKDTTNLVSTEQKKTVIPEKSMQNPLVDAVKKAEHPFKKDLGKKYNYSLKVTNNFSVTKNGKDAQRDAAKLFDGAQAYPSTDTIEKLLQKAVSNRALYKHGEGSAVTMKGKDAPKYVEKLNDEAQTYQSNNKKENPIQKAVREGALHKNGDGSATTKKGKITPKYVHKVRAETQPYPRTEQKENATHEDVSGKAPKKSGDGGSKQNMHDRYRFGRRKANIFNRKSIMLPSFSDLDNYFSADSFFSDDFPFF